MHETKPNIAVIGGGTGSHTLLKEFKEITPNLTAVVNMSDDGGSSGILREKLGVMPPGDARQCLAALASDEVSELLSHRLMYGHAVGNLFIADLELRHGGDFTKAMKAAGSTLGITGRVLPVTTQKHILVMQDGANTVRGEYQIGSGYIVSPKTAKISHEPQVSIALEAEEALHEADVITIAPGNFFGSILSSLAVKGMRETLRDAKAEKVMVTNLVNKPDQTPDWHVKDYVDGILQYVDSIDHVIYNTETPTPQLLAKYVSEGELPVRACPEELEQTETNTIGADLVSKYMPTQQENDVLIPRNLIRHDAKKVGHIILGIASAQTQEFAA